LCAFEQNRVACEGTFSPGTHGFPHSAQSNGCAAFPGVIGVLRWSWFCCVFADGDRGVFCPARCSAVGEQ
jgi:hypothetical protein